MTDLWSGEMGRMRDFNIERFNELYLYLTMDDCDYGELQELRDKIHELLNVVLDKMEAF